MNKIKKVVLLTLGGTLGGMVGTVFSGMMEFLRFYFRNPNTNIANYLLRPFHFFAFFGAIIGLGISFGYILPLDRHKIIKVLTQAIVPGFICFALLFSGLIGKGRKYYEVGERWDWDMSCHLSGLSMSIYFTILCVVTVLGIIIGEKVTKKIKLFGLQVMLRTIVTLLVVTPLCISSIEIFLNYIPMIGGISFGIILFSINKK